MSDKLVVEIDSKDAEVAMRNLDRLTTAAEQMGKAFENTKGATSALRELRLMLTGIKGQGSSLDELKNSIQSLNSTADSLKRSFAGSVGQLGRIFKNEMAELKSIVQETGLGVGRAAADSLSDGIASPESRRKVAGAMRAQVAEMQAAYEQELAKGVKFSGRDLFDFKSWGLNIGADAKQAIRDGLVKDAAPIPVEKILGLDKSQVVKSAKDSAAVFQEAYSVEMAQGRLLFKNFERALGLDKSQVVKSAKDSAVVFREAYNAEMRSMQRSAMPIAKVSRVDAADATYASAMAQMKDYYKELESSTNSGVASAGKMSNAFKRLTIDGNDVHSMARGLASGFNLLWLTWGNLVPLFIGAAISNGFIQTAKTGMQVAHTLETIATLGGNTAEEMAALNIELDRIGNSGPFGPLAVAESMKVLALAGLKANEILAVTQDVLNFSIAGTTDLKTAADALVSISTAFGMGAAGFGRVSDVVSKAAAESKTSVESFANAMKTASVINKQYGVSLEDTATGIAALSQLGIEGAAAGTALRNMYADLSGRSIQVSKVLKAQGIEMRDTVTGGFRPMLEVVAELNTKLQGLDAIGQKNLLQAVLSERGAKGIVELLQLINTEAKNAGAGMSNALQQMRKSIEESYGFAAISAAKLSQTAESQFKAVKATLETSMNDAYKSVEPTLRLIADALRKAFSSPEFIAGLSQLVTMTAQLALSFVELTRFIVEHQGAIAAAAAAYSLISLAIRHKAAAMVASTAATTADTTATLANNAAKAGAVGALGTLGRIIPGLGTAITLAAGAWMAYDFWQGRSKDTATAASDLYNNNIIKNLNDEANRLRELNDLRAKGLTLSEAQQLLNDQNSREKGIAPASNAVVEAIRNEYSAVQKLNKARAEQAMQTTREGAHRVTAAENALAAAKNATSTAKAQEAKVINELADAQARVVQERKRDAGFLAAEAKKREELFKSGTKGFGLGAGNSAGNSAERRTYQDTKVAIDNRLAEIVKGYNKEKEEARNAAADEKAMLDSKHRNGLISEGEYQSQLFNITKESEQKQLAQIKSSRDEYSAIYQGRIKELADQWLEAKSRPTKNEADRKAQQDDLNKIADAWENLGNTATTEIEKMDSDARQLASKGMRDLAIASDNAAGAIYKLRESERKYWADDKATLDKAKALDAVNAKYRNLNDSVFSLDEASRAYEVAAAESTAKHEAHIEELTNSLNVAELAAQAFWDGAVGRGGFDTGEFALWLKLKKVATDTGNAIADAKTKAGMSASAAGQTAFDRKRKEQNTKLASDLSDAVMTGLFDGAEAGKKKLRDVLVAELRKPIKMVVDLTMNAAVNGIMNSLGLGGAGGGGGGGIMGMASNASSAYNMVAGGGAFAGALGSGFTMGMGGLGSMGAALEGGAAMLGSATGVSSALAGIGQIAGALGPIALGIGAIVGLSKLFGANGTQEYGGVASYSAAAGNQTSTTHGAFGTGFGGVAANEQILGNVSGIAQGIVTALDATAKTFGQTVGYEAAAGFASDFGKEATWGGLKIALQGVDLVNWDDTRESRWAPREFDSGEEGYKQYLAEIAQDTRKVLLDMDLPSWADEIITSIGDAASMDQLSAALQQIGQVQAVFKSFGQYMTNFATLADSSVTKLAAASGGIDALAGNMSAFVDGFYRDSEKLAINTQNVTDALAKLGFDMPATRDEFKAMVQSQIALGDAGAQTTAGLLAMSNAVSAVLPPFEDAAAGVSDAMKRLQSDTAGLQIELLRAQGNTTGANAAQRTLDTAGFNDAEIAIYDYNNSLRLQIQSISDAAEAIKGLKEDTANLEIELLRAQGNNLGADAAQRAIDIAGYDAAAIAIYDYNAAIRKQIEELEKSKEASQAAIDNLGRLASRVSTTFNSLESAGTLLDKIGSALGLGAGTYAAEKEKALWTALSVSNGEKQVEIAGKLTEIVLARQQLEIQNAEKLLDFSKNLKSYVDSLKLGATSPLTNAQKLAEASRQYTGTLSKAKAGDVDAQAKIQSISSGYLGLAQAYYAGNETYENIFNSVVSELDALGLSSMSESQQQLAVGNKSLAELQKLYAITESTYSSLSTQYENQLKELSTARDDLLLQENSLSELKGISTILSELPAEIGARISKSGNYFSDNPDVAAAYQQDSYGLSAEDFAYTHYMKYGKYEQRNLPSFATGIANVPYDMTANIHSGERVMTAKDNSIFSGIDFSGQGTRELVEEVRNLREEVRMLRNENREDAQMQAKATSVSSESAANKIAESNSKVVYNATVKQGAKIV